MDFVSHIGDIVLLENEEKYLVLGRIVYEDDPYLLICKVEDFSGEEQDIEIEYKFAKEIVREKTLSLALVEDKEKISNLFNKLKNK